MEGLNITGVEREFYGVRLICPFVQNIDQTVELIRELIETPEKEDALSVS